MQIVVTTFDSKEDPKTAVIIGIVSVDLRGDSRILGKKVGQNRVLNRQQPAIELR